MAKRAIKASKAWDNQVAAALKRVDETRERIGQREMMLRELRALHLALDYHMSRLPPDENSNQVEAAIAQLENQLAGWGD